MVRAKGKVRIRGLTLAFIETHPADAARVLEHLVAADAAALLDTIPATLAAPVIGEMIPAYAARCLETLRDDVAAGLIQVLGVQAGSSVLRYLPAGRRSALLEQLPGSNGIAYRLLLGYPEDTVGALMELRSLAVAADTGVKEALARVRRSPDDAGDFVYVVDADRRLQGIVRLVQLVRANQAFTVAQIMRRGVPMISAQASLHAARRHEGWREFHVLPVVESQDRFVGALRYAALIQALAYTQPGYRGEDAIGGAVGTLTGTYWQVIAGLIQATVSLLPQTHQSQRWKETP